MRRPATVCAAGFTAGIAAYETLGKVYFPAFVAALLLVFLTLACKNIGKHNNKFHNAFGAMGISSAEKILFMRTATVFLIFLVAGGVRICAADSVQSAFCSMEGDSVEITGRVVSESSKSDGSVSLVVLADCGEKGYEKILVSADEENEIVTAGAAGGTAGATGETEGGTGGTAGATGETEGGIGGTADGGNANGVAAGWQVTLRGELSAPSEAGNPKAFDYAKYLRSRGIRMTLYAQGTITKLDQPRGLWRILNITASFKESFTRNTAGRMDEETAGLLAGIMFGDKGGMDTLLYEDFQKNGIAHLLAVSGLHISLLYGVLRAAFRKPQTIAGNVPLIALLLMYTAASGFTPSVVRAVFMIFVHIFSSISNRKYDFLSCISFCGGMLLLYRPEYLFSSGFQMSFMAVLTIALVMPRSKRKETDGSRDVKPWKKAVSAISGGTAGCAMMQAGMIPLTLYHFHYVSIGAFFLNAPAIALAGIIVPVGTAIMPLCAAADLFPAAFGTVTEPLLDFLCLTEEMLLKALIGMNSLIAGTPLSFRYVASPCNAFFIFYYGALFFLCSEAGKAMRKTNMYARAETGSLQRRAASEAAASRRQETAKQVLPRRQESPEERDSQRHGGGRLADGGTSGGGSRIVAGDFIKQICKRPGFRRTAAFLAVLLAVSAVAGFYTERDMIFADVVFVDVGQGDCAHIKAENSTDILFDSGGSETYDTGKKVLLPYLLANGVSDIDLAVLSHLHQDHCGGLETASEYIKVEKLLVSSVYRSDASEIAQKFHVDEEDIIFACAGDVITAGNVKITVLAPERRTEQEEREILENEEDENELSLISKAEYNGASILFTGDIDSEYEEDLVEKYGSDDDSLLRADVLKVAHHGSKYSTCSDFLEAVKPETAVIQVGRNNYGHPSPDALSRLEEANAKIRRNDTEGAIFVKLGKEIGVRSKK